MEDMNNRVNRLRMLIDSQFKGSQADFSRKTGINASQVTQWLSGYRSIGEKVARKIELTLDLPINWLDQIDLNDGDNFDTNVQTRGSVPIISWVQAGHWQQAIDNLSPGEGERFQTTVKPLAHTYALRVKGDSMEPTFPDGCIIVVEPQMDATHGDFVIIRQNGDEATFKELIFDGAQRYLKPINPRYPIMELKPDAELCGVVVQMGRNFRSK